MQQATEPFAHHLALDLYGCGEGTSGSMSVCREFLESLVTLLGLIKQVGPFVCSIDGSLSGWVPLTQSSIQVHGLAGENFVSIDIHYSGRLHSGKVLRHAKSTFQPRDVEMRKFARGAKHG